MVWRGGSVFSDDDNLNSYDERLKTMVLREEFFPQMEEMKTSVDVMTKAANGNICQSLSATVSCSLCYSIVMFFLTLCSDFLSSFLELLDCDDLHSVIRLVLKAGNYMNAVSVLHEKYSSSSSSFSNFYMYSSTYFLNWKHFIPPPGRTQWECHRLPDEFPAPAVWHQSQ